MRNFHHSIPTPQLFFVKAVCRWRCQIRIHFTDTDTKIIHTWTHGQVFSMHFYCNVHADVMHAKSHVIWYRQPVIDTSLIHPLEVAPSLELFAFTHPRPPMPRSQNFMQIPREARPLCLCNRFVVMISIVICDWICFIGVSTPEWKKSCRCSRRAQYPHAVSVCGSIAVPNNPLYQYDYFGLYLCFKGAQAAMILP